jgi:hypothetical protein
MKWGIETFTKKIAETTDRIAHDRFGYLIATLYNRLLNSWESHLDARRYQKKQMNPVPVRPKFVNHSEIGSTSDSGFKSEGSAALGEKANSHPCTASYTQLLA